MFCWNEETNFKESKVSEGGDVLAGLNFYCRVCG